jgi:hypothetical protein
MRTGRAWNPIQATQELTKSQRAFIGVSQDLRTQTPLPDDCIRLRFDPYTDCFAMQQECCARGQFSRAALQKLAKRLHHTHLNTV